MNNGIFGSFDIASGFLSRTVRFTTAGVTSFGVPYGVKSISFTISGGQPYNIPPSTEVSVGGLAGSMSGVIVNPPSGFIITVGAEGGGGAQGGTTSLDVYASATGGWAYGQSTTNGVVTYNPLVRYPQIIINGGTNTGTQVNGSPGYVILTFLEPIR